jgi:hypothetical protein
LPTAFRVAQVLVAGEKTEDAAADRHGHGTEQNKYNDRHDERPCEPRHRWLPSDVLDQVNGGPQAETDRVVIAALRREELM